MAQKVPFACLKDVYYLLRSSILKMIILPRQARDKHRESSAQNSIGSCFLPALTPRRQPAPAVAAAPVALRVMHLFFSHSYVCPEPGLVK
jgi:hypothetical protein